MGIRVSENNIHIDDSHAVSKRWFKEILLEIKTAHPECRVFVQRPLYSLKKEWALHNALYALGIMRGRTADVDLNAPMGILLQAVYVVLGGLAWPFIK